MGAHGRAVERLQKRIATEQARSLGDARALARLTQRLNEARESQQGLDKAARLLPGAMSIAKPAEVSQGWFAAKYHHAKEDPNLLLYKLQSSAYKYSWALRRLGALWRTGWMLVFAAITSTAFALLLLYLGTAD